MAKYDYLPTNIVNPFEDKMPIINNSYIKLGNSIIVLNLTKEVAEEIKTMNELDGLGIGHIIIESPLSIYKELLTDLVQHFIYHSDTIVNFGTLMLMSGVPEYYAIDQEVCNTEQRKITDNDYQLFPITEKTSYDHGIEDMFCTYQLDDTDAIFFERGTREEEVIYEEVTEEEAEEMDLIDLKWQVTTPPEESEESGSSTEEGEDPEPTIEYLPVTDIHVKPATGGGSGGSGGSSSGGGAAGEVLLVAEVMHETYTIPVRHYASKNLGSCSMGMELGFDNLIIERKVLNSKFRVIHETEEETSNGGI